MMAEQIKDHGCENCRENGKRHFYQWLFRKFFGLTFFYVLCTYISGFLHALILSGRFG